MELNGDGGSPDDQNANRRSEDSDDSARELSSGSHPTIRSCNKSLR